MKIEPAHPSCFSSQSPLHIYVENPRQGAFVEDHTPLVLFSSGGMFIWILWKDVSFLYESFSVYIFYCRSQHFTSLSSQIPVYTIKRCPIISG